MPTLSTKRCDSATTNAHTHAPNNQTSERVRESCTKQRLSYNLTSPHTFRSGQSLCNAKWQAHRNPYFTSIFPQIFGILGLSDCPSTETASGVKPPILASPAPELLDELSDPLLALSPPLSTVASLTELSVARAVSLSVGCAESPFSDLLADAAIEEMLCGTV